MNTGLALVPGTDGESCTGDHICEKKTLGGKLSSLLKKAMFVHEQDQESTSAG